MSSASDTVVDENSDLCELDTSDDISFSPKSSHIGSIRGLLATGLSLFGWDMRPASARASTSSLPCTPSCDGIQWIFSSSPARSRSQRMVSHKSLCPTSPEDMRHVGRRVYKEGGGGYKKYLDMDAM